MLTLDTVSKRFALKAGLLRRRPAPCVRGTRGELSHRSRRDLRAGRRVGQRQNQLSRGWRWACIGPTPVPLPTATAPATCTISAGREPTPGVELRTPAGVRVPGSGPLPESAYARREAILLAGLRYTSSWRRRGRRPLPRPGRPGGGRAGRSPSDPPTAGLLRRPAPARRYRPRADRAAGNDHLRRDRLRPRRIDPQPDSRPCCSGYAANSA